MNENNNQPMPWLKLGITGIFMGLANLVPGVSGGTMVLALGLYDEFIGAMSDVTRLRFTRRAVIVLAMLFGISFVTIAGLAGVIELLMEMFKPGMLALFIGMTLGGAPAIWKSLRPADTRSLLAAACGIGAMALIAFVLRPDTGDPSWFLFFVGGVIASSSMILPGISGSYMLLILGLYLPVIGGISQGVDALRGRDWALCVELGVQIGVPLGLGIVAGIIALSNLIKFCLDRFHRVTLGFLLGLLLGSVLGLYPFQPATFDKLPRYAREAGAEAIAEPDRTLMIAGYGWDARPGNRIHDDLKRLERAGLDVRFLDVDPGRAPTLSDVELARETGAVMIVYDQRVPRDIRRTAARKVDGEKVELLIVPDVEFNPLRGLLVLGLIAGGFCITFFLSRLGKKKPAAQAA